MMGVTGWNQGAPRYGIGAKALASLWIERERAMRATGTMGEAANILRLLRREMQEALDLVVDPDSAD